jgi:hypothetical protein
VTLLISRKRASDPLPARFTFATGNGIAGHTLDGFGFTHVVDLDVRRERPKKERGQVPRKKHWHGDACQQKVYRKSLQIVCALPDARPLVPDESMRLARADVRPRKMPDNHQI